MILVKLVFLRPKVVGELTILLVMYLVSLPFLNVGIGTDLTIRELAKQVLRLWVLRGNRLGY